MYAFMAEFKGESSQIHTDDDGVDSSERPEGDLNVGNLSTILFGDKLRDQRQAG